MNDRRERQASNDGAMEATTVMPAMAPATGAAPDSVVVPLRAARGDDDLMSQPAQAANPSADATVSAWIPRIPAATIAWGKLTEAELRGTEGDFERLASLVRDRYGITRHASEEQVCGFLDQPVD